MSVRIVTWTDLGRRYGAHLPQPAVPHRVARCREKLALRKHAIRRANAPTVSEPTETDGPPLLWCGRLPTLAWPRPSTRGCNSTGPIHSLSPFTVGWPLILLR